MHKKQKIIAITFKMSAFIGMLIMLGIVVKELSFEVPCPVELIKKMKLIRN